MSKSDTQANEKQIFVELIQKHQGIINKLIYLYEDHFETQADLRQEVMLQAWKSYSNFRGNAQFSTWLYRVTINTILSWRRKEKIQFAKEIPNLIADSKDEVSSESELLWRAIKSLEAIDRTLITMHLDGYSNEEVADTLGISVNNTGVKLHRVKKKLSQLLTKE